MRSLDFSLVAKGKALSKQVLYYDFRETTQVARVEYRVKKGSRKPGRGMLHESK